MSWINLRYWLKNIHSIQIRIWYFRGSKHLKSVNINRHSDRKKICLFFPIGYYRIKNLLSEILDELLLLSLLSTWSGLVTSNCCCSIFTASGVAKKFTNLKTWIKGQIISECPYEKIVYPKIATKKFPRFLPWPLRRGQIKNFIKPIMLNNP